MSDFEWESWQKSFQGAAGPLPDIRAKARSVATRHRLDNLAGMGMIGVGVGVSTLLLASGQRHEAIIGSFDLAFTITILIGFVWIQRGVSGDRIGSPRDAIAFLERRIRAERRGSLFAPPLFLALFFAAAYASHAAIDAADWPLRAFMIVLGVAGTAFPLSLPWLVWRRTRAEQAELARWRAWLTEQGL